MVVPGKFFGGVVDNWKQMDSPPSLRTLSESQEMRKKKERRMTTNSAQVHQKNVFVLEISEVASSNTIVRKRKELNTRCMMVPLKHVGTGKGLRRACWI